MMLEVKVEMKQADTQGLLFSYFNEIGIISQLSSRIFEQRLPDGLTLSQFAVLNWFIRVDTEATPGRLAKAFQVTGGAMTNTQKKLEARELDEIQPAASSGRQKRVTLTRKGSRTRDACIKAVASLFEEFAEVIPVGRITKQIPVLEEVRTYLDEYRYREF